MWNYSPCVVVCLSFVLSSGDWIRQKHRATGILMPETINKRLSFEEKHQEAFSSNIKLYGIWPEIQDDRKSTCGWLLKKILSRKDVSEVTGEAGEISLMYKHIKDENNKPFAITKITSLVCRFHKRCYYGTHLTFIRSPDPTCAHLVNRLTKRTKTYYIAEEICKLGTYPKFWDNMMREERSVVRERSNIEKPDTIEQRENHEKEHKQAYQAKPVEFQKWPELKQADTQVYCHMILQKCYPGTGISISDIVSETRPLHLIYKRIKRENGFSYPLCEVCALSCFVSSKFYRNFYQFIRTPKFNCLYLIKKVNPVSTGYRITKEICDYKWRMINIDLNKKPEDINDSSVQKKSCKPITQA